jgi:hypothetical protein
MKELIDRLDGMRRCIYIAVDEAVARDISDGLTQAIAALEAAEVENAELRARVAELEGMVLKWVSVLRALDEDETRAAAAMAKGGEG